MPPDTDLSSSLLNSSLFANVKRTALIKRVGAATIPTFVCCILGYFVSLQFIINTFHKCNVLHSHFHCFCGVKR